MKPQWHPYLFIIFFATLFEYNLHRLITVLTNRDALNSEKHRWVKENLKRFYLIVFISVTGFIAVIFMAKKEVLITFAPIVLLTMLYSIPVTVSKKKLFRLREIPYLKIFLIATVWSTSTILLPIVQSENSFSIAHVAVMLVERFLFIFAITIPFDIRDLEADRQANLKTIPMLLNSQKALSLSYFSLLAFFLISFFHYQKPNEGFLIWAFGISAASTFLFLWSVKFRKMNYYHYGILDGTSLLQGLLVLVFYYFTCN